MRASRVAVISLTLSVVAALLGAPVSAQTDPPAGANVYALDDVAWIDPADPSVDIDVIDNDSYPAGDLTVTINADPTDGTATVGTVVDRPMVTYSPNNGFDGTDTIGYEICVDGACDQGNVDIYVGNSACTIVGTNGADTLTGTEGDDVICGRKGADTINGLGGDDVILGGKGADVLDGGAGNDSIFGGRGNDIIRGGDGDDLIKGGRGDDTLTGGDGNDRIAGKEGADQLNGGPGDDVLRGWQGPDELNGGAGNDRLYGGKGQDVLNGGEGDDELWGRQHADQLHGGPGNDVLRGNLGPDDLYGGPGIDVLNGGQGNDTCRTGETNTGCETIIDSDTEPPTVEVAVDNQLETTGQLTLTYTITDNSGPVDNVVLVDPGGYSYEIAPNGDGTWTSVIDTDRLFPDTTYDFILVANDASGNVGESQIVSVSTPPSGRNLPSLVLQLDPNTTITDLVSNLSQTGADLFQITQDWTIENSNNIPDAWLTDQGTAPADLIGQSVIAVMKVGKASLAEVAEIQPQLVEQDGMAATLRTATVIAPSDSSMASLQILADAPMSQPATSDQVAPNKNAAGVDPIDGPFWPDQTWVTWNEHQSITVDGCFGGNFTGSPYSRWCPPGTETTDLAVRQVHAQIMGLDTNFRPYFNARPGDRSYEIDIKQINLNNLDFDNVWIHDFGWLSLPASYLEIGKCPSTAADEFPINRFFYEERAGHHIPTAADVASGDSKFAMFYTNVNSEARPYPDTWIGDKCHEMGLSFGIAKPELLRAGLDTFYFSLVSTDGRSDGPTGTTDSTTLELAHQSLDRDPLGEGFLGATGAVKKYLCEKWSGHWGVIPGQGPLGNEFCTGVIVGKTRTIDVAPGPLEPGTPTTDIINSAPWIKMRFRGLPPGQLCVRMNPVSSSSNSATGYDASKHVLRVDTPWELQNSLVEVSGRCSNDTTRITSPHRLPALQTGLAYSYQLRSSGSWTPTRWRAVEDPVSRYARTGERFRDGSWNEEAVAYHQWTTGEEDQGLPRGLSLDPATGLITGTPMPGVGTNPSYVTVLAEDDNGNSAVKQFVFDGQAPSTTGVTIDVTPSELTVTGITGSARFVLDNSGITPLVNYVLRVELPPGVTPTSGVYQWDPVPGYADTYQTTFPDVPSGQARQTTMALHVPADYRLFDGALIRYSYGPGSASSDYPQVYWWALPQL